MIDHPEDVSLAWRDAPGMLPRWARRAVIAAGIATIAILAIGGRTLWQQLTDAGSLELSSIGLGPTRFQYGLAWIAAVVIAVIAVPRYRLARSLRLAVLLPVVHVGVIVIAWTLWQRCASSFIEHAPYLPAPSSTPLLGPALGLAAIGVVCALIVTRGRRDAHWTHAFALYGLVLLLALGLWSPIVSSIAATSHAARRWFGLYGTLRELPLGTAGWMRVVVPPIAVAISYTWLAIRRPARTLTPHHRGAIAAVGFAVLAISIALRLHASPLDALVYGGLIPLLLAAALVACSGIAMLVIVTVVRDRILRRRLTTKGSPGTVVAADDDESTIGALQIAGWLRAPRTLVRPFILATPLGQLPIPGARLVAAVAPSTTCLHVGESVPVVRAGDAVIVAGLERASRAGPFRSLAAPVANEDLVVARADSPPSSFADVAFATWRPAVAYLGILVIVALPALAAIVPLGE